MAVDVPSVTTRDTVELDQFRHTTHAFLAEHVAPHVDTWERQRSWPARELYPSFGTQGLLGLGYERRYGGAELDFRFTRAFCAELGSLDCGGIGMSVSVQTDMCTPALAQYGSDEARDRFLRGAIAGTAIGSIALTEESGGSDFNGIATTLTRRDGDYLVRGRKVLITNATVADFHVVLCRTSATLPVTQAFTLVVVPADEPGVSATPYPDKLGNLCCDHGDVTFDDVRIPAGYVIGAEGLGYPLQAAALIRERLVSAVIADAQARRLLARATAVARGRSSFGGPLIEHDRVADRLVALDTQLTLLGATLDTATREVVADGEVSKLALVTKNVAARAWVEAADCLLQLSGGSGYMTDTSAQRAYRDARAASIAGGTDEVLRRSLAGYLP
ncbi:MAG: acyl-CoA dehydrogenase family protein [Actinocatenispora sp.]